MGIAYSIYLGNEKRKISYKYFPFDFKIVSKFWSEWSRTTLDNITLSMGLVNPKVSIGYVNESLKLG